MLNDPRHPSLTRFVIQGMERDEASILLSTTDEIAECEPLQDCRELVHLRLNAAPDNDGRTAWRQVCARVARRCQVLPVLENDDGSVQFPTGTIQVRFVANLTDDAVHDFARDHGLDFVGRNAYQPLQAAFRIAPEETAYQPDVVERLDADPRTHAAWPEVLDRPKRNP